MINVGDIFTGIYGRKEVVTSIWLNDKTVGVESGLAYSYEEVYKSWYQQQKQRADEAESIIKDLDNLYLGEKKRADELKDIIERFLYANRESDIYAICSEQELVNEYERIKIKFSF